MTLTKACSAIFLSVLFMVLPVRGAYDFNGTTAQLFGDDPGYRFKRSITIDRTKVGNGGAPTTLTDFPFLFSSTDDALKTLANGGQVTDSEGDDIIFRDASGTQLDHEVEFYDGSTGEFIAWVRLPTVNTQTAGSDTIVDLFYGNGLVTASTEDITGVWDSNFIGVWHLDETSGTTNFDSTSNANDGTKVSATEPNPVSTGQIDGAQDFDGTDDFLSVGSIATVRSGSAWVNHDDPYKNFSRVFQWGANQFTLYIQATSHLQAFYDSNQIESGYLLGTTTEGTWFNVAMTFDGSTVRVYVDGVQVLSEADVANDGAATFDIGRITTDAQYWDGLLEEVRVSSTAQTVHEVVTDYNNQNEPDKDDFGASGFYTLGSAESQFPIFGVHPFSMACWFNSDVNNAKDTIIAIADSDLPNEYFSLQANGLTGGDPVTAEANEAGSPAEAVTTTGFTIGTWHHAAGVFISTTSRSAYIDGGSKGTDTVLSTPEGMDRVGIGRQPDSTPGRQFDGLIAECGVWSIGLSDDDVASLAKGFTPPQVRPQDLIAYWPLKGNNSPEIDHWKSQRNLIVTDAVKGKHAPQILYQIGPH